MAVRTLTIPWLASFRGFERLELLNLTDTHMRFGVVGASTFIREVRSKGVKRSFDGVLGEQAIRVISAAIIPSELIERVEFEACYELSHP